MSFIMTSLLIACSLFLCFNVADSIPVPSGGGGNFVGTEVSKKPHTHSL